MSVHLLQNRDQCRKKYKDTLMHQKKKSQQTQLIMHYNHAQNYCSERNVNHDLVFRMHLPMRSLIQSYRKVLYHPTWYPLFSLFWLRNIMLRCIEELYISKKIQCPAKDPNFLFICLFQLGTGFSKSKCSKGAKQVRQDQGKCSIFINPFSFKFTKSWTKSDSHS